MLTIRYSMKQTKLAFLICNIHLVIVHVLFHYPIINVIVNLNMLHINFYVDFDFFGQVYAKLSQKCLKMCNNYHLHCISYNLARHSEPHGQIFDELNNCCVHLKDCQRPSKKSTIYYRFYYKYIRT